MICTNISLTVLLSFVSIILYSQKFEDRRVDCFSPELNTSIYLEGVKINVLPSANIDASEARILARSLDNSISKSTLEAANNNQNYVNWERNKEVTISGLADMTKTINPLSSPFLTMLETMDGHAREDRIKIYEGQQRQIVKDNLKEGLAKIGDFDNRKAFENFIDNSDNIFEDSDLGSEYNKEMLRKINVIGANEREQISKILDTEKKRLDNLHLEHAKGIKKMMEVELNAVDAYFRNKEEIDKNRLKISKNTENIVYNRSLIEQNALRTTMLETAIVKHEHRIRNNEDEISNIKTQMTFKESSLTEQIDGVENGKFDRLFIKEDGTPDVESKQKFLLDTKRMRTKVTVNKIASHVGDGLEVASQALTTFFPDADPGLVKAVNYGVVAANVMGSITSGNYAAAAMQVIGLFGGQQESQEVTMLKQVLEEIDNLKQEMHGRFDRIDGKLNLIHDDMILRFDAISNHLEIMHKDIVEMHIRSMQEIYLVQEELDYIKNEMQCLEGLAVDILNDDLNSCYGSSKIIKLDLENQQIKKYSDYESIISDLNCGSCVLGIENFLNKGARLSTAFNYRECNVGTQSNFKKSDVYSSLKLIWEKEFDSNEMNDAMLGLLYPTKFVSKGKSVYIKLLTEIPKENKKIHFNFNKFEDEPVNRFANSPSFKSYNQIKYVTEYFLLYMPFIEMHKGQGQFYTYNEITNTGFTKRKVKRILNYLLYLNDVVDFHLAQQSLMSGNLLITNFEKYLGGQDIKINRMCFNVLRNNKVFCQNYSNLLLATNFNRIETADAGAEIILYNLSNLKITYTKSINYSKIKYLKNITENGVNKEPEVFELKLPPFSTLNSNPQFIFTTGFYEMITLRQKLQNKLKELQLIYNLDNDNYFTSEEFKNIIAITSN